MADLLKSVGTMVLIDKNILLHLKGKFVKVCLNIDIILSLLRSLTISKDDRSMRVPLIYKDLHEACPLCSGDFHPLESCPNVPVHQKIEVVVEKFGAHRVSMAKSTPLLHLLLLLIIGLLLSLRKELNVNNLFLLPRLTSRSLPLILFLMHPLFYPLWKSLLA